MPTCASWEEAFYMGGDVQLLFLIHLPSTQAKTGGVLRLKSWQQNQAVAMDPGLQHASPGWDGALHTWAHLEEEAGLWSPPSCFCWETLQGAQQALGLSTCSAAPAPVSGHLGPSPSSVLPHHVPCTSVSSSVRSDYISSYRSHTWHPGHSEDPINLGCFYHP